MFRLTISPLEDKEDILAKIRSFRGNRGFRGPRNRAAYPLGKSFLAEIDQRTSGRDDGEAPLLDPGQSPDPPGRRRLDQPLGGHLDRSINQLVASAPCQLNQSPNQSINHSLK